MCVYVREGRPRDPLNHNVAKLATVTMGGRAGKAVFWVVAGLMLHQLQGDRVGFHVPLLATRTEIYRT